jgi:thioredoxin-dependent peroxiredoxin
MGMRLLIGLLLLTVTGPARQASAADEAAGDTAIRRTADGLIAVGSRAPSFTLPDGGGKAVRLGDLLNRPLVLYFYPMDETPGCTTQACTFRDDSQRFDSLGVRVVGISTDPPSSHRSFADHHQLPFTLLSDTLATVSRLYGVAYDIERSGTKRTIARRVTYLIDREGRVRHVWPKADPAGNSTEVLAVVRKLLPDLHR